MNLLAGHNNSGVFWIRYMLEIATRRPTKGSSLYSCAIGSLYPIGNDLEQDNFAVQRERLSHFNHFNKILFVVRNFRDVFTKDTNFVIHENTNYVNYLDADFTKYINLLDDYENCSEPKMLVYYEDLIESPEETIKEINSFFEISESETKHFLENYEQHFRCCAGIFNRNYKKRSSLRYGDEFSTGGDIQEILMYNSPKLFSKYLIRYFK